MAELTTPDGIPAAASCCGPEQQSNCCAPSDKATCCDPSHGDGCACGTGQSTAASDAPDIREQVRQRYAEAALSVTTVDPGSGCCAPSDAFDGGSDVFGAALYALGDQHSVPDTAALASLGCGNPTAVARRRTRRPALRQTCRSHRPRLRARHDRRDARSRPWKPAKVRC
jgi:arsenite methyltransferase